jgi:hypothetical protein
VTESERRRVSLTAGTRRVLGRRGYGCYLEEADDAGLVDVVLPVGLGAGGPRSGGDREQEERGGGGAAGGGRGWELRSPVRRRRRCGWPE